VLRVQGAGHRGTDFGSPVVVAELSHERVIGSIRREYTDHMVLGEERLIRTVREYRAYYTTSRGPTARSTATRRRRARCMAPARSSRPRCSGAFTTGTRGRHRTAPRRRRLAIRARGLPAHPPCPTGIGQNASGPPPWTAHAGFPEGTRTPAFRSWASSAAFWAATGDVARAACAVILVALREPGVDRSLRTLEGRFIVDLGPDQVLQNEARHRVLLSGSDEGVRLVVDE
jgi:hypothetical protein